MFLVCNFFIFSVLSLWCYPYYTRIRNYMSPLVLETPAVAIFLNMSASRVSLGNEGEHKDAETGWLQELHCISFSQQKEINIKWVLVVWTTSAHLSFVSR